MSTFPVNWTPRPYQAKFLQDMTGYRGDPTSAKKKALLVWGRQLGKDTACGMFMFKEALQKPGNYFYIFPRSTDARRAFWEKVDKSTGLRLVDQIPGFNSPGEKGSLVARVVVQEMLIELTNHSTIRILGLDQNPDAARGISPAGVVFSEAAYMDPAVFAAIEPAIAMNKSWVIFNSTPNGANHFYKMWKHANSRNDWHTSFHQCYSEKLEGYYQLDGIDEKYFTSLVESGIMSEDDVEREYGCNWDVELKGSYYSEQIIAATQSGRIGMFPYNRGYAVSTYWDLGMRDATVCWFAQHIRGKTIFIDYHESVGQEITEHVMMLAEKGYRYDTHVLPWDAYPQSQQTGLSTAQFFEQTLQDLQVSGYVAPQIPKLRVQAGIDAVRRRFPDYCFNEATTREGLDRLELYHRKFDKRTGTFGSDPVHDDNSHAADALRMEAVSEDLVADPFYELNDLPAVKVLSGFDED